MTFYDWLIENEEVLGVGAGLWCPLHIALMVFLAAWLVCCFFICKKFKNFALKFTKWLCWFMIVMRLFRMALLLFSGKQTFLQILPWHLCHLMCFVISTYYLRNWKKGFFGVLAMTFFGGILTFIFGDYYTFSTLSFLQIESLVMHFVMPTVVIGCVASGHYQMRVKNFWQAGMWLAIVVAWSSLGNLVSPGNNFLYLQENGLPFTLFGWHFYFTYAVLVVICGLFFLLFTYLVERLEKRKKTSFDIIMGVLQSST